ncbi:hypothetical protein BHM03_00050557 [Ensete ventricosum]|nr:hypothetical protein BHM03_00050557 [Ensete ventricosum]
MHPPINLRLRSLDPLGWVGSRGTKIHSQPSDRDLTASVSSPGPLIKSSNGGPRWAPVPEAVASGRRSDANAVDPRGGGVRRCSRPFRSFQQYLFDYLFVSVNSITG